jgi:hypothetical protein
VESLLVRKSYQNRGEELRDWSISFQWDARAAQYDAWKADDRQIVMESATETREDLENVEGLLGYQMLQAAEMGLDKLLRKPKMSVNDLVKLVDTGSRLLRGKKSGSRDQVMGDRLDLLSDTELDQLESLLDRAKISLEEWLD